jgi:hypothetical protein
LIGGLSVPSKADRQISGKFAPVLGNARKFPEHQKIPCEFPARLPKFPARAAKIPCANSLVFPTNSNVFISVDTPRCEFSLLAGKIVTRSAR